MGNGTNFPGKRTHDHHHPHLCTHKIPRSMQPKMQRQALILQLKYEIGVGGFFKSDIVPKIKSTIFPHIISPLE